VLAAGVKRVVVGAIDPNPRVRGKGIAQLRRAGIAVTTGVLAEECREVIADFEKHVTTGLPFVVLKLAATLDGRIATASGDSRWVTGEAARRRVHGLRNRVDAVVVGSETVLQDDPELSCRIPGGRDPLRVVLDGRLRCPEESKVFRAAPSRTWLYTRAGASAKAKRLAARGVTVRPGAGDRPGSLRRVLRDLGRAGVTSVLVEGGGTLAARALRERLVDRLSLFLAPKLLGGDARPMLGSLAIRRIKNALPLEILAIERVAGDLWLDARPAFRRPV